MRLVQRAVSLKSVKPSTYVCRQLFEGPKNGFFVCLAGTLSRNSDTSLQAALENPKNHFSRVPSRLDLELSPGNEIVSS